MYRRYIADKNIDINIDVYGRYLDVSKTSRYRLHPYRKALAIHNKNEYIKNNVVLSSYNISETEFKDAIQHATNDKGQCSKTGGGSWCPTVTESDQKILELLKDQVTPLPNEFDSAATFFGDTINVISSQDNSGNVVIIDNGVLSNRHEADLSLKGNATPKCAKTPKIVKRRQNATTPHRPKRNGQVNYKLLYFKRKSQNAYLERRRIHQEIRLRQKEHSLLLKEHQIRLQHMEEEHKMKMNK